MNSIAGAKSQVSGIVLAALNPPALAAVQRTALADTLGRSGLFATVEIAVVQCSAQLAAG